ncbi:helix-turn-helix domain-containing protein [Actinoplanes sp. NPDC051859]|uniref:helix-turn-helix domain-containing protein n=1 Tax=Actinoplanes sp. NPDC051859 TaxID=3363909 RepID=UPI0037AEB242
MTVDSEPGSTVPRRQLGRYLRQLREESGLTVKAAADVLECSFQKVWRIEKGAVPVRSPDVRLLCQAYQATPEMTEALAGLARETKSKGWWQSYGDAVPDWFELYVGLEGAASRLRKFEPSIIPGLLQARAYMEAVILADQPDMTDPDLQSRIAMRTERQGLLSRHFPPPPSLEVIVDEGALRRSPTVPGAMQQQLWHLLKANELPHLSVRVLPLTIGPHRASVSGAFTILDFPSSDTEKGEPSTIYSESLTGALYLDKPKEIQRYDEVWSDLSDRALTKGESQKMITVIIGEMNNNE